MRYDVEWRRWSGELEYACTYISMRSASKRAALLASNQRNVRSWRIVRNHDGKIMLRLMRPNVKAQARAENIKCSDG